MASQREWDRMGRDLEKIMDLCGCGPAQWSERVQGGDLEEGPHVSQWTCPDCSQLVVNVVGEIFPDVKRIPK